MADELPGAEQPEPGLAASILERGRRYSTGILGGESGILDGMVTYRESTALAGMTGPGGDVVSRSTDFTSHLQSLLSHNEGQSRALRVAVDQPPSRFFLNPPPGHAPDTGPPAAEPEEPEAAETGGSWMEQLARKLDRATEKVASYEQTRIPSGPAGIDLSSVLPPPDAPAERGPIRRRSRIEEGPTVTAGRPPIQQAPPVPSVESPPVLSPSAREPGQGLPTPPEAAIESSLQRTVEATNAAPPPTVAPPILQRRRGRQPASRTPEPSMEPGPESVPVAGDAAASEAAASDAPSAPPPAQVRRTVAAAPAPPPMPTTRGEPQREAVRVRPTAPVTPAMPPAATTTPPAATTLPASPPAPDFTSDLPVLRTSLEQPAPAPGDRDDEPPSGPPTGGSSAPGAAGPAGAAAELAPGPVPESSAVSRTAATPESPTAPELPAAAAQAPGEEMPRPPEPSASQPGRAAEATPGAPSQPPVAPPGESRTVVAPAQPAEPQGSSPLRPVVSRLAEPATAPPSPGEPERPGQAPVAATPAEPVEPRAVAPTSPHAEESPAARQAAADDLPIAAPEARLAEQAEPETTISRRSVTAAVPPTPPGSTPTEMPLVTPTAPAVGSPDAALRSEGAPDVPGQAPAPAQPAVEPTPGRISRIVDSVTRSLPFGRRPGAPGPQAEAQPATAGARGEPAVPVTAEPREATDAAQPIARTAGPASADAGSAPAPQAPAVPPAPVSPPETPGIERALSVAAEPPTGPSLTAELPLARTVQREAAADGAPLDRPEGVVTAPATPTTQTSAGSTAETQAAPTMPVQRTAEPTSFPPATAQMAPAIPAASPQGPVAASADPGAPGTPPAESAAGAIARRVSVEPPPPQAADQELPTVARSPEPGAESSADVSRRMEGETPDLSTPAPVDTTRPADAASLAGAPVAAPATPVQRRAASLNERPAPPPEGREPDLPLVVQNSPVAPGLPATASRTEPGPGSLQPPGALQRDVSDAAEPTGGSPEPPRALVSAEPPRTQDLAAVPSLPQEAASMPLLRTAGPPLADARPVAIQRAADSTPAPMAATPAPSSADSPAPPSSQPVLTAVPAVQQPPTAPEQIQRVPAVPPAPAPAPSLTMAAQPVQRALEATGSIEAEPQPERSESKLDIDELSDKVWRKLEDRIRIEKERQFGLP